MLNLYFFAAKPPVQRSATKNTAAGMSRKMSLSKSAQGQRGDTDGLAVQVPVSSSTTTPIPPIETVMRGSIYAPLNELGGMFAVYSLLQTKI